jgi:hypothetical protein
VWVYPFIYLEALNISKKIREKLLVAHEFLIGKHGYKIDSKIRYFNIDIKLFYKFRYL